MIRRLILSGRTPFGRPARPLRLPVSIVVRTRAIPALTTTPLLHSSILRSSFGLSVRPFRLPVSIVVRRRIISALTTAPLLHPSILRSRLFGRTVYIGRGLSRHNTFPGGSLIRASIRLRTAARAA